MEPFPALAATPDVPTGIPTGAADATKALIDGGGIWGALLFFAGLAIIGLAAYIRSLHSARSEREEALQKKLDGTQEKRVEELRATSETRADVAAVLSKFTDTVHSMGRTLDALGASHRESAFEQRATAAMMREAIDRIEDDVAELSKKIDKPLMQTPYGLTRNPGAVP